MRIAITLICIAAAACLAWSSPTSLPLIGFGNSEPYVPIDTGREIKWAQYPHASAAILSQFSDTISLDARNADDFLCDDPDPIRAIEWWGIYAQNSFPTTEYFIVRVYAPDSSNPASPGALLYEQTVMTFTKEEVLDPTWDYWRYTCSLPVPFDQTPGETYWLSIQQVTDYDGYNWYWMTCIVEDQWGYDSTLLAPSIGYPDWTPSLLHAGYRADMAFVLFDEIISPVEDLTWGSIKALFR
jgi:hypothetical protein